jgi:hypothetical protein
LENRDSPSVRGCTKHEQVPLAASDLLVTVVPPLLDAYPGGLGRLGVGYVSTGQAAKELKVSRQGAINLAESRKVRTVKTACGWLYDPESVRQANLRDK